MPEGPTKGTIMVATIGAAGAIIAAYISSQSKPAEATPPPGDNSHHFGPTASKIGVPEEYQGTWSGSLTLATGNTTQTVPLIYQIGPGRAGDVVGTFQQPQCNGQVIYESGTGPIQFADQVTSNPYGRCAPSARARAVLVDSRNLSVTLFSGNVVMGQGILGKP